ncbi:MAG: hypothetical protein KGJ00_23870 [Bradyrhizobium sp.]|nr:hypothetical protein [Bradyrhizobium sp.]
MEQAAFILKALCFLAAGFFVIVILAAQQTCSLIPSIGHQCNGPDGDVWMLPFFFAPIGIPALIATILISIMATRRS